MTVDIGVWSDPEKLVARLKAEAEARPSEPIHALISAWSVAYSAKTGRLGHVFSARIVLPRSRERDWAFLGRLVKLIGAPDESTPDTLRSSPDESHYWIWGGEATKEEADAHIEFARSVFRRSADQA